MKITSLSNLYSALSAALPSFAMITLSAGLAFAGPGTDFVKSKVDTVRTLAAKPVPSAAEKAKVDAELMKEIAPLMNFPKMSEAALGKFWQTETEAHKKRFVELFQELVFHSYMKRIRAANKDSSVEYVDEMPSEGGLIEVEAEAKTKKMEIELRFKLSPLKEGFEVADVVIDEVSLVSNYREQFTKIITKDGFEALLKKMEEQVKKVK